MAEKRMLIMPGELVKKIDDNRGDMTQSEFIDFLIDGQLKEQINKQQYATRDEVHSFEQDMKKLLKSFLDFFVSYGLELGKESPQSEFEELTSRLKELEDDLDLVSKGKGNEKEATIKWK